MHPEVNSFLLYELMDEQAFQPIFEDLIKEEVLFIYKNGLQSIGMCKLIRQKHRNEHIIYLGGLAIHPDYFGQGFGKKMLHEIISFCKTVGILRIELSVAVSNDKAIQLYEKVGFVKEGVLRKYTYLKSKDQFIDEILMSNIL